MGEDKNPVTAKILSYTMEILFLLTGEDYVVVKKHSEQNTGGSSPQEPGLLCMTQSPISGKDKKLMTQKILELTNKIIEVLTAEDVTKIKEVADSLVKPKVDFVDVKQKEHCKDVPLGPSQPHQTPGEEHRLCTDPAPEVVKMEVDESPFVKDALQSPIKETPIDLSTACTIVSPKILVKSEPEEVPCVTPYMSSVEKKPPVAVGTVQADNRLGIMVKNELDQVMCMGTPLLVKQQPIPATSSTVRSESMPGIVVKPEPEDMRCVSSQLLPKEKSLPTSSNTGRADTVHEIVVKMEPDDVPMEQQQPKEIPPVAPAGISAVPAYIVTCIPDQTGALQSIDAQRMQASAMEVSSANPAAFAAVKCQWGTGPWIQTAGSTVMIGPATCVLGNASNILNLTVPSKPKRPTQVFDKAYLAQRAMERAQLDEERHNRPQMFRLEDAHLWDPIKEDSPKAPTPAVLAPVRVGNTDWCSCTNCFVMPTEEESVCCHNIIDISRLLPSRITCICDVDNFKNKMINREYVKELHRYAASYKKTHLCKVADMKERDVRKVAYRAFTLWIYGHLGRKSRRPIPSCVVDCVRAHFSALDHTYIGIRTAEDDYDAADMCAE
ncbi:uncharacterized protein O3C94_012287 isoform 1-T2 [Discoglossus pictus]